MELFSNSPLFMTQSDAHHADPNFLNLLIDMPNTVTTTEIPDLYLPESIESSLSDCNSSSSSPAQFSASNWSSVDDRSDWSNSSQDGEVQPCRNFAPNFVDDSEVSERLQNQNIGSSQFPILFPQSATLNQHIQINRNSGNFVANASKPNTQKTLHNVVVSSASSSSIAKNKHSHMLNMLLSKSDALKANPVLTTVALASNLRKGGNNQSRAKAVEAANMLSKLTGVDVSVIPELSLSLSVAAKASRPGTGSKRSVIEDGSEKNSSDLHPDEEVHSSLGEIICAVESKKKRLARKAELARMTRKRKQTRLQDLEAENERLMEEIATLKKQRVEGNQLYGSLSTVINDGSSNDLSFCAALYSNAILNIAQAAGNTNTSDTPGEKHLLKLIDHLVQAHKGIVHAAEDTLHAFGQCLSFGPSHFFQWLCSQNESFDSEEAGLWGKLLIGELGCTDEQMKDFAALRTTIKRQSKLLPEIIKTHSKLQILFQKQCQQRIENLEKIRAIFKPHQTAAFIKLANRFGSAFASE